MEKRSSHLAHNQKIVGSIPTTATWSTPMHGVGPILNTFDVIPAMSDSIDRDYQAIADQFAAVRKNLASDQQHRDLAAVSERLVARVAELEARVRNLEESRP